MEHWYWLVLYAKQCLVVKQVSNLAASPYDSEDAVEKEITRAWTLIFIFVTSKHFRILF